MPVKINSSGGGSVSLTVPSVATDYTLTLPGATGNVITSADTGTVSQGMIASGVAGKGPAFYAYANGTTSVLNNTFTKINLDTVVFDTNSNFATGRFTPTVPGYYQITGEVTMPSAISQIMQLSIYKNGAEALRIGQSQSAWWSLNGSGLLYMNGTTDYIELYFYQLSGGTVSVGALGSAMNYMCAFLARSA